MDVLNFLFTVHTGDKLRNKRNRPRAVQCVQCGYFQKTGRMHLAQCLLNELGIELEYAFGQTTLPQLHRLFIIGRNLVQINIDSACLLNQARRIFQHDQGFQSQKVKLNQPRRFQIVAVILARRQGIGRVAINGRDFCRGSVTNNHAACMLAQIAQGTFQFFGNCYNLVHVRVGIQNILNLG